MEFDILTLVLLFYILGQSSQWVVDSLVGLGIRLRVSKFVLGLFVLGIATSAPEFLVGLSAVIDKVPTLSLGNVLGASFVLLTFVTGIAVVLNKEISISKTISIRELLIVNGVILIPGLLVLDGTLSRMDGIVSILAYVGYMIFLIRSRKSDGAKSLSTDSKKYNTPELIGFLIFGLIIMTLAAKYSVDIGSRVAEGFGIPPLVIGLLVFSVGTNLPELVITYKTKRTQNKYLLFGDILGSSATNTLVIGLVAFSQPIILTGLSSIYLTLIFLIGALIAFDIMAHTGKKIVRAEGYGLLGIYIAFIILSILMNIL